MPFTGACTIEEQLPVIVNALSARGGPAAVDGAVRVTVQSGDGTAAQDAAFPLQFKAVSGSALGDTVYLVEADADLGAGVTLIQDTYTLTATGVNATSLGMTSGAAEPKGTAFSAARSGRR